MHVIIKNIIPIKNIFSLNQKYFVGVEFVPYNTEISFVGNIQIE